MPLMDMTPQDRERLAARLIREQRARFSGVAKDAYTAAGVNSATWKRVVEAQTIKPHKLVQIVVRLWPETFGDWTKIPDLEPGPSLNRGRRLADLVDAYRVRHPIPDASIAAAIGVSPATLDEWRTRGIDAPPPPDTLRKLAALTGRDYTTDVLRAVLLDLGLVDEGADESPAETA